MTELIFPNRKGTSSIKHDFLAQKFGANYPDLLPLWVADMDIAVPDFLSSALTERASHPAYGYSLIDQRPAVKNWQERHHYHIQEEWIIPLPNVVFGLGFSLQAFTKENDKVIINPPVYPPFFQIIEGFNRQIASAPLIKNHTNRFMFDLSSFDKTARLLFLCNPHNPVGRVWKKEELLEIANFCLENKIIIISDEIHADFIYPGNTHLPIASLSDEIADITITLNSASKTFNLSGLSNAYAIIKNPKLRAPFDQFVQNMHLFPNLFGALATKSAYESGAQWPGLLMVHIEKNCDLLCDFFKTNMPNVKCIKPEGTYLLWLDFTDYLDSHEKISEILLHQGHLALSNGEEFGAKKFFRVNLATSTETIEEAIERFKKINPLLK